MAYEWLQEIRQRGIPDSVIWKMNKLRIGLSLVSILMLLLGIPKGLFPYGYYNLLRVVVCATGVFLAVNAYQRKNPKWIWIMGITAFIFNPLFPIHLGKEIWVFLDVVTAVFFCISLPALRGFKSKEGEKNE